MRRLLPLFLLLSACGGQDDTEIKPPTVSPEQPDSFLRFLDTQASLAAGDYQVIAATAHAGVSGDYTLTVTHDGGDSNVFTGSWAGSAGRVHDDVDNPAHDVTLAHAGGLTLSLESDTVDTYLFLVRNGEIVARDDNSGEGTNALIDLPVTKINSVEYSRAYYEAVDPYDQRTTLEDWKAINGFGTGDCLHVVFRDTKDLGYGRNMRACRKTDGDMAVFVDNYVVKVLPGDPDNYGPLNLEAALKEQRQHHLGTNAIEFTRRDPMDPGSERIAKFFTFAPDGQRNLKADLDGRGEKAMPQPCLLCHGATLLPLEPDGGFPLQSLRSAKLNQLEVDSFELASQGAFSGNAIQDGLRELNEFIHGTFADMETRDDAQPGVWTARFAMDIAEGRYDGDFGSGHYNEAYVPPGWQQTASRPEGVELLYKQVVEPHCIACHSLRGSRTGERVTQAEPDREGNAVNFSSYEKFIGYSDLIIDYVYKRGVMPLSIRNYNSFWEDRDGPPALLASFLPGFDRYDAGGSVLVPGAPIARTGADRTVTSPVQLDGSASHFVRQYRWRVLDAPADDWSLTGAGGARPVLTAPTDGSYRLELTVINRRGSHSTELELEVDATLSPAPKALTFTDHIAPILQSANAGTREACVNCHTGSSITYEGVPVVYTNNGDLYRDVLARVDLAEPENSILLRRPTREQHGGGVVIDTTDPDGRAVYETLVNWIREGAVCGSASYCP